VELFGGGETREADNAALRAEVERINITRLGTSALEQNAVERVLDTGSL
jgi:hypothetical protein